MDAVPRQAWREIIFMLMSGYHLLKASIDHGTQFRIPLICPTVRYLLGSAFPKPCYVAGNGDFLFLLKQAKHFFLLEVMPYREKI